MTNKEYYYERMSQYVSERIPMEKIEVLNNDRVSYSTVYEVWMLIRYTLGIGILTEEGEEITRRVLIKLLRKYYTEHSDQLEKDPYLCSMKDKS